VIFIHAELTRYLQAHSSPDTTNDVYELPAFADCFHLAAVVGGRSKIEGDLMGCAINTLIDTTFLLWCVQNSERIGRVLYVSSSAAYPISFQNDGLVIALEERMLNFDEHLGMPDLTYGWSKLTGEYLCRLAASNYGLHVACVRPFSGYGVGQALSYPIPALAGRIARGDDPVAVWGTGRQTRDFVYIDDFISAMVLVLDQVSDGRAVNIGSGQPSTFIEVIELLAEIAGYWPRIQPLLDKPVGVETRYADITMLQQFGWRPCVPLRVGLARVLEEQQAALAQVRLPHLP